jgi:hypothetical protein
MFGWYGSTCNAAQEEYMLGDNCSPTGVVAHYQEWKDSKGFWRRQKIALEQLIAFTLEIWRQEDIAEVTDNQKMELDRRSFSRQFPGYENLLPDPGPVYNTQRAVKQVMRKPIWERFTRCARVIDDKIAES